jgi:vacuolar protein sorting-associated protein 18
MLALQNELTKGVGPSPLAISNPVMSEPGRRQAQSQRTLLSANFNPLQNSTRAANLIGRNLLSAGDRIRDLIIPDALAAIVSAPTWIPGVGGRRSLISAEGGKKAERLRSELEELLASSCPLCESVVVGVDRPFVKDGEIDNSWAL